MKCVGSSRWAQKRCSGISVTLKSDPKFMYKRCTGRATPVDCRQMAEVTMGREKLQEEQSFCYLRDCSSRGGCGELASMTTGCHDKSKLNELLTILTSSLFPITSRRKVYNSCVGSVMFYVSKTWDPTSSDLHRLQPNDRAMIRWICGVTTIDQVSSQDLLERMQLDYTEKVIHSRRLRQHGHVEHSDGWMKKVLRTPGQK